MTLLNLKKISFSNIEAAGPRYSPSIDPNSPNLEIFPLISAIEALAITDKYKIAMKDLKDGVAKAWQESSKNTKDLFKDEAPRHLADFLVILTKKKPGRAEIILRSIKILAGKISSILQEENKKLWDQQGVTKEYSEERRVIESELSSIRKLDSSIRSIFSFINSPNSKLVTENRMLLLGEWGTGKTHFLCDVTKERINHGLPTLFFLAHRLPAQLDPLEAICKTTQIASTPKKLLKELDSMGKAVGSRSLLIIDGINESDRKSWRKYIKNILSLIKRYPNIALVLSCRSPFDKQIITKSSRNQFVQVFHVGFQDIEFDAQRSFFKYYKIPNPHIPLLTPEFSRPLFLKILCSTFSGQTLSTKSRWINEIASGQRSMTKILEDFVSKIGSKIESDFKLPSKTCWKILKGEQNGIGKVVGITVLMAEKVRDYLNPSDCLQIIKELSGKTRSETILIFNRIIADGLLVEDVTWENGTQVDIIRLPYQRFSDHLISRHLLKEYLDTTSEQSIRRSFYGNKPLGKIFRIGQSISSYQMPGLASALMLEFPERVKKVLPTGEREVVYYLPKKQRLLQPLIDTFLEGVLWRSKDSFSKQTDNIFGIILGKTNQYAQRKTLEVLVSLACRPGHPYSAERLYKYLNNKGIVERDLLWSEFLRNSYSESVINRILNWIDDSPIETIDEKTAETLITLLSLFLTTTDRSIRDRTTRCLVSVGQHQPNILFKRTVLSLSFNDPYLPERMLAASYGVLMRLWAFPNDELKSCISDFAKKLYDAMFMRGAPHATTHILTCDYALGIIDLSRHIKINCLSERSLKNLKKPFQPPVIKIPSANKITEGYCEPAKSAIHMDFENYTIGRLVSNRSNYDSKHKEYRGVLRQIKWRILNLGYSEDLFKNIDRSINENDFYRGQREKAGKVDRYGKKYSWIAFYEVAGMRSNKGLLPERYANRISDCDIDPSFPEKIRVWSPVLKNFFCDSFTTAHSWAGEGGIPTYDHLLEMQEVDGLRGPWVLLNGYISESSPSDPRKVFTFVNGVFAKNSDIPKLKSKFNAKKYPGNREIPGPWQDNYTFAGEVPWSIKYGGDFHRVGKNKRHIDECFDDHKQIIIRKKASDLSKAEKLRIAFRSLPILSVLNKSPEMEEKMKSLPKYIEIPEYKKIPGVPVEVPIHSLLWESYHSDENQNGNADYLAPAICDFLRLKNKNNAQDLFDEKGNQASIFRVFGDSSEYFKSTLLYIRKDLLKKYLLHTNQKLVWFLWGERDFKHEYLEAMRSQIQDIWASHKHIYKKIKVAK